MNSTDVEAAVIGALAVYPDLFQHCILKHEYFTAAYRELYQTMTGQYEKHGNVEVTELAKNKGFNINLYMKCTDLALKALSDLLTCRRLSLTSTKNVLYPFWLIN